MGSQIDPRLHGYVQQQQHHHQQQHQQHPHQHPLQQHPHQLPQQFTPPQPVRLPHIHQVHDLSRLPPQYQHPQQNYYNNRLPPPGHPPQFSSPSGQGVPLPPLQEHVQLVGAGERQGEYPDDVGSPGQGGNGDPNDPKRSRACEACRGLKVRCDQDPNDPAQPCKRCAKAKRNCVITAPSRKRQKKTDSRVAELEKKIDALTASLNERNKDGTTGSNGAYGSDDGHQSQDESIYSPGGTQQTSPMLERRASVAHKKEPERKMSFAGPPPGSRNGENVVAGVKRRRSEVRGESSPHARPNSNEESTDGDMPPAAHAALEAQIDAIIDRKRAARTFDRYVNGMIEHLPVVVFDPGTTAAEVRLSKPVLFLAILVAASKGLIGQDLQEQLNSLLLDTFANCIIRHGAKSLELIQALLISTIWYRPPRRYEQMNFYQLIHIAAVMAIDIGMGKRLKKTWRTMGNAFGDPRNPRNMLSADTVEVRRTWLGCYFQSANSSMSLRRPNLIRWNNYMDECIEMLESSSEALATDKLLCQHVRLMHINEEIGQQFSMDDPSATVTIGDKQVQLSLRAFERALGDWSKAVPKDVYNTDLEISTHVSGLYMHEVALHMNHNVDDFRAPFTEESLKAASGQSAVLSPAHSAALSECLTSVHGIFNTFFAYDLLTVRALPIFYFIRIAYAVVVLIKLHFAVLAPNSEVGKIISKDDLNVDSHLDRLLDIFHTISKDDAFRPANKFLLILGKLREWFLKNKDTKPSQLHSREPSRWSTQYDSPSEMGQQAQLPGQQHPDHQQQQQLQRGQQQTHLRPPMSQMQSASQLASQQQLAANSASPLHFLSEVAMTHSPHQNAMTSQTQQQQPGQSWYPMQQQQGQPPPGMDPNGMDVGMNGMSGLDYMGMGTGFEQAMDMTLGPGGAEGDISNLFMGEPMFSFGLGMGMDGMEPGSNIYGMGW